MWKDTGACVLERYEMERELLVVAAAASTPLPFSSLTGLVHWPSLQVQ
jgi:hypothetical protein